ncbi:endonuclease MutS2 [Vagococcus elongatus]|uniref:Mannonate oxidoreductase n=1 Tax=Vagococcus elongatus TaxID=180344 RepID=A0A430ANB3_9ENTE|nr:endonuclease MutS2 [Vagococcus elongatus]RSU09556.1 mannonate oxidoreductase [Vagococcus elongatus]
MNQDTIEKTEFIKIIEELKTLTMSPFGKKKVEELKPSTNLRVVQMRLAETEEARRLLDGNLHVPFMGLTNIDYLTEQVSKGFVLNPEELVQYADFLRSCRLIKDFFKKHQAYVSNLSAYSTTLGTFPEVEDEINKMIQRSQVSADYHRELRRIRKKIQETESEIEKTLQKFLRNPNHSKKIQEFIVVKKQERFTIPIKASYKNQLNGSIVEESKRGTTAFIEPSMVAKLNDKLFDLKVAESAEVYQILAGLTGMIAEHLSAIKENIEIIGEFDVIFARAKYSRQIQGITPKLNQESKIVLCEAEHPLLTDPVPLTLAVGKDFRGLTITGPNAGGKTIVLKTVALLTLQTMTGLQIKAKSGTEIAIFDQIFVDIGDHQSIENALSTFSGHMKKLAMIAHETKGNSLLLLDEIGSGTDPKEGAALAIAMMEDFYSKGSILIATTHYGEIKRFSELHPDFETAAMSFDSETLAPKYQLQMGEVGTSNAFWIAEKMHLPSKVIKKAQKYEQSGAYDLEKKIFSRKNKSNETLQNTKKSFFHKGDKIYSSQHKTHGLVFEDDQISETIIVSINKELLTVSRQRVTLTMVREALYPAGYDYDSLFDDYQERKLMKDLLRGAKKAHNILDKQAQERKNKRS